VAPWGRSFDEYRRMFALTDDELSLSIVGSGDGPASFNAEATRLGAKVISCDPIYRYDVDQLRDRIASTYAEILDQTRRNAGEFVWSSIRTVEELGQARMAAMDDFLDDYPAGKSEGRYIDAELPAFHSATHRSTWRSVHIFCFCTLRSCARHSISPRFARCAVWPRRFRSFRSWRWVERPHHWSTCWSSSPSASAP